MDSEILIIGFAGDVMIGRSVEPVISSEGYSYVWGDTIRLFHNTDINVVNLETTLTKSNKKVPKVFNFKAAPDKVRSLSAAHVSIANLANNHILDFSENGLLETIDTLKAAGILYSGAGRNLEEASKSARLEKKNFRIGVIGFTDNEPTWRADIDKSGTNYIDVSNQQYKQRALELIWKLRKEVDIVIVSIHWGPNMQEEPSETFIGFAHDMIDHGADIIHGHSAHIFQGIEVYHKKLVLYDTGDFVDDYVVDPLLKNDHSFFYRVEMNKQRIESVHLDPVLISNYQVNLAKGKNYEWSIKRIQKLSSRFGTVVSDTGSVEIEHEK